MTKIIAAAAGLAVAGAAQAELQAFSLQGYVTGTSAGALQTAPLSGDFVQVSGGADFQQGVNTAFFGFVPALEFDTYLGLDEAPVNAIDNNADAGTVTNLSIADAGGPFDTAGQVNGTFFAPGGVSVASGDDFRIFFGRFQLASGDLSGEISVRNFNGAANSLVLAIGGGSAASPAAGDTNSYELQVDDIDQDTVGNRVVDLYIAAIPAPGAAGLLGLAGLAASRRRR